MNTTIINTTSGKYNFKIFRKDAITNIQIKSNSCHDEKTKIGVFKGYISRARSICSKEFLQGEIEFITNVFFENGYDAKILKDTINNMNNPRINNRQEEKRYVSLPWLPQISTKLRKVFNKIGHTVSFKSPTNLKNVLTNSNKDPLPANSYPGVYIVSCECSSKYIGQTKNRITKRCKQHEKNVFYGNNEDSAIATHANKFGHEIKWDSTKTLARESSYFKRCVRESLEIRKFKTGPNDSHGMNQDYGQFVKTTTWDPLLNHLMTKEISTPMTEENTAVSTSVNRRHDNDDVS